MLPDILSMIRDIAIIVMALMVTVAAATVTVVVLKSYSTVRRAVNNFELSSRLALDTASRVAGLVTMGSELGVFVWELISRFRGRDADEPPPEEKNAS